MEGEALSHPAPFAPAFLRGEPRAEAFLPADFARPAARVARVRAACARRAAPELVPALRRQSQALPPSPARDAHLELLGRAGTGAVVTGQQVGLFLGPLYTLYKAATAVAVARALSQESGCPCVPVFWLQTEDHDLAEVDHCHLLDAEGTPRRLQLPTPGAVPHAPVSELVLGREVEGVLAELGQHLGEAPRAAEVLALVRAHYRPGASLAQAFAGLLAEVFRDDGLVLLDPRDPELARATAHLHRRALEEAEVVSAELLERQAALRRAGFEAQVHVREGAPLSFFHPGGARGPRYRLAPAAGGRFALVGGEGEVSREAVLAALAAEPRACSSSALLRPMVQDTLLPTAAVVGGPGEVNYFAQLAPLYRRFGLPPPLVVPRARFRLVEPRTRRALEALGLGAAEVEAPAEAVLARRAPRGDGPAPAEVEAALVAAAEAVLGRVPPSKGLERAFRRTRGTVARAASRFAGRLAAERVTADEATRQRLARAQAALFPHGEPQERVFSFASFAARVGVEGLGAAARAALTPFSTAVAEVAL